MKKTMISNEWQLSAPGIAGVKTVDLPNDFTIGLQRDPNAPGGAYNAFVPGGTGRYVKYLEKELQDIQHAIIDVDGAYMCSELLFNETHTGMHPHGYAPYLTDVSNLIRKGRPNRVEIITNAIQPSTRWYSGGGVFRDVYLWTGGEIRMEPGDVFAYTETASETEAVIRILVTLTSDRSFNGIVTASLDDNASCKVNVGAYQAGKCDCSLALIVHEPRLWNPDKPELYTLRLKFTEMGTGQATDEYETVFGIRTVQVDAHNGLRINGKTVKMRGGCIHHDHGVLGSAAFPCAEERKLTLLMGEGLNAIRTSHNPPSRALLDACDRLGIVVIDEAFDMWARAKTAFDYHLWFSDHWKTDLTAMIRRDRNHPCIIAWSTGNEVPESSGTDGNCAGLAQKLADAVRENDPTRPVSVSTFHMGASPDPNAPEAYKDDFKLLYNDFDNEGIDQSWETRTEKLFAPYDLAGYNYMYTFYRKHHMMYPERVMWGSETHALNFYDSWHTVLEMPSVIGDFTWTAYDNLGEAGTGRSCWARDGYIPHISTAGWPWRTCYQGDLDLCGYRRPQSFFRQAVWQGNAPLKIFTTHPEHYGEGFSGTGWHWYDVLDTWTFDDQWIGKPVLCEVYVDCDTVEWYVNGSKAGESAPEKAIARFTIPYEKGEIKAVALKSGMPVSEAILHTVGYPNKVSVSPEKEHIYADGRDLCWFDITVCDGSGERVPDAKNELTCIVNGGELLGIFSGDPANEDAYTSPTCHAFTGRAVAVVRTKTRGSVTVNVGGPGLLTGTASVNAL